MPEFDVPQDVAVEDFFKNYVPKQFEEQTKDVDLSFMEGKEFTLQFNVDDKKFCLVVKNGKELEVVEGGIDKPMITLGLSESFWRDTVTGKLPGVTDSFTDPNQVGDERRYNALLGTKGTVSFDLKMEDDSVVPLEMTFNGETTPSTKLKLAFQDWLDIQKGDADGQALFMQGKMEFEGDMMFLMQLQQLM